VVEHFRPVCVVSLPYRPLCVFRSLANKNRPQGGDFTHFEKHCSNPRREQKNAAVFVNRISQRKITMTSLRYHRGDYKKCKSGKKKNSYSECYKKFSMQARNILTNLSPKPDPTRLKLCAGDRGNDGGNPPCPFVRGETGEEVPFHNSIIVHFMVYKGRLKTKLLQLFLHPEIQKGFL